MKIAVIGASGFFGRNIVARSIKENWDVTAVYHNNQHGIPAGCKLVKMSEISQLEDDFDLIFLAVGNFAMSCKELVEANVNVTNMVSKQFPNSKIVFISSVSVYGAHNDVIKEDSCFNNPDYYGLSKIAGEFVASCHERYAIVRMTYLYGPGMGKNSFIPIIINKAISEHCITIFGDGKREQDYVYIDDAVDLVMKAALSKENGTYLGSTGMSVSNLEVAQEIISQVPDCKLALKGEDKTPSFKYNSGKTKLELKWEPKYTIKEGIIKVVEDENSGI